MRHLALALCLLTAPAFAEDSPAVPSPDDGGFSLMEEGAKLLLRGLISEMQPALDDMGKALTEIEPQLRELGPKLHELIKMIDDIQNYLAPEIQPNGDIIIRRKPGAPPSKLLPPAPPPQIDL